MSSLGKTTKQCTYSFKIKWLIHDHWISLSPKKKNKGNWNKEDREFLVFRLTKKDIVKRCPFSMCTIAASRLHSVVITRWRSEEQRNEGIWMIFQFPFWTVGFVTREGQHYHQGVVRAGGQRPMQRWDGRMTNITHFSSKLLDRNCWGQNSNLWKVKPLLKGQRFDPFNHAI